MASPDNIPLIELPQSAERQLGSLLLTSAQGNIALPLGAVEIAARVADRVAQVTVKQVFRNNLKEHMEAVYIFPLAPASAIFSFDMKVKDRVVKGVVNERAEARRQYQQALADGKRTALMEQERDDVFTVQVGNLPPGEEVTIEISYSERLPFFENGESELRLPLVVAPRFIPGGALDRKPVGDGSSVDTHLVPDASRISPPRLAPGVDPGTALKLKVEIISGDGAQLADLHCSQHATRTALGNDGLIVTLARIDEKLNRDFVLRWRSVSDQVKSSLTTYRDADGETYGLLSIMPPRRAGFLGSARDIVFVLDRSGSMQGIKITSAVRACSILLNTLGPADRFAIAAFDNTVEWMPSADSSNFVRADAAGIENGEKYLRTITARGGTELDRAMRSSFEAIKKRPDKAKKLSSLVVLTDGEVGNESQILQRLQREIGESRLFVVGIDTAVNSGLLKRLANLGGGTAAFVEPGIQLEEALTSISRDIGAPLVTDLQVEDLDLCLDRASLSPGRIPDLFAGRASVCFFKVKGQGKLVVKGKLAGGKTFEQKVKARTVDMPSIAQLWAKAHIVDLEDQYRIDHGARSNLKQQIVALAVKHCLLTKFTAFVAVDEAEIVNQTGSSRKVIQPVEEPDSWGMDANAIVKGSWAASSPAPCQSPPMGGMSGFRHKDSAPEPGRIEKIGSWGGVSAEQMEQAISSLNSPSTPAPRPPAPASPAFQAPAAQAPQPQAAPPQPRQAAKAPPPATPASPPPQSQLVKQSPPPAEDKRRVQAPKTNPLQIFDNLFKKATDSSTKPEETYSCNYETLPAPGADLKDIFNKLDDYGSSVQGKRDSANTWKADLSGTRNILVEFFKEFAGAFQKLEDGNLPDASRLEKIRLQLVQTLAPTMLGMELPCLQRFLRATAIDLVSSLKDSSVAFTELQEFWASKKELYEEIKREMNELLSRTEAAFWESSI